MEAEAAPGGLECISVLVLVLVKKYCEGIRIGIAMVLYQLFGSLYAT